MTITTLIQILRYAGSVNVLLSLRGRRCAIHRYAGSVDMSSSLPGRRCAIKNPRCTMMCQYTAMREVWMCVCHCWAGSVHIHRYAGSVDVRLSLLGRKCANTPLCGKALCELLVCVMSVFMFMTM